MALNTLKGNMYFFNRLFSNLSFLVELHSLIGKNGSNHPPDKADEKFREKGSNKISVLPSLR